MKQIYVHGLGQTPQSWEKVIENLDTAQSACNIDLVEMLRGKETTYGNLYASFAAVCNESTEPFGLCGLSLGGVLALNYAVEYPEKVGALVLVAAQYKMPKKLLQFQNVLFRFMPKSMFRGMGFAKSDFLKLCNTMMELDFSNSLSEVNCPVLVVCGEKDKANKQAAIELTNNLKNAELHIISNTGHEINQEAPDELADVLNLFYQNVI